MTNKEITSLAIKVFAIYILLQAILMMAQTGNILNQFFQFGSAWLIITPVIAIIGLLASFYMMWKLGNNIIAKTTKEVSHEGKNNKDFNISQRFILQAIGLYLLITGFRMLFQSGMNMIVKAMYVGQQPTELALSYPSDFVYLVSSLLEIILAISLIVKPLFWRNLLHKFRTFGLSNK